MKLDKNHFNQLFQFQYGSIKMNETNKLASIHP